MPSTLLADCVKPLADTFLALREDHERAHPGVKIAVDCTYRSPEEQFEAFKHGRRQLPDGSWVIDEDPQTSIITQLDGFRKRSKHNSRPAAAIDFRVIIQGKTSWRIGDYLEVGRLAQDRGLVWGGTWGAPVDTVWERVKAGGFVDVPHLEVKE